jgi:hypothetical protein
MQFHLVSLNNETSTGERWQIHKANCRYIEKLVKRGDRAAVVIAASPEALFASQLADQLSEMGWSVEDFRIMPCSKDGPQQEGIIKNHSLQPIVAGTSQCNLI